MNNYDNTNKGAVWLKTSKNGLKYMSGTVNVNGEEFKIRVMKNDYKKEDKQPDYRVFIDVEETKKEETKKDMSVYEDFANEVELTENDLPF